MALSIGEGGSKRSEYSLNGRVQTKEDYPRALRYKNTVPRSCQRILNAELESIQEMYEFTKDELLALRHWVSEGNSAFSNPDNIQDEHGIPCDFIAAYRILENAFTEGGDLL